MSKLSICRRSSFISFIAISLAGMLTAAQDPICMAASTIETNSARSMAMGGASIVLADGNTGYLSNPASLALLPRSAISAGVGGGCKSQIAYFLMVKPCWTVRGTTILIRLFFRPSPLNLRILSLAL